MDHDRAYFRRRAAEARAIASHKGDHESIEVAGHLTLAYAALARREKAAESAPVADEAADRPILFQA